MKHLFINLLRTGITIGIAVTGVFPSVSQPIPANYNHRLIIDTDCAIDDYRAINMILSIPEVTVLAFIASDGTLDPEEGTSKLSALVDTYYQKTIPVIIGKKLTGVNPPWREFNRQVKWGTSETGKSLVYQSDYIEQLIKDTPERIVILSLGPLTDIAAIIRNNAAVLHKIEKVIWYNESAKPGIGFNYQCDTASAREVFNSGIRIDVISALEKKDAIFDNTLFASCNGQNSNLSNTFNAVFRQPDVNKRLNEDHFYLWDDLAALYLINPELFDMNTFPGKVKIRYNTGYNVTAIKEAITDMMKGRYSIQKQIVFSSFPTQPELFSYDVREIMDSVIRLYGMEEWKASVMTDEFHGHLGVFSIVGAKMGIKARELFGVGPDMLHVMSDAGSRPPYSCLNDGIQVSTGATLGMGLIKLSSDTIFRPSAVFTYNKRSIRLTLKKEYLDRVNADIQEGIVKYGLMDDGYWKLIRRNAIRYWLEWDRNKIFDVE
ncbi:MAG TPA: nucleoside hydrolase [Bacteroidales bacterium]|nr:nucleoside hydrolase [Bacteroidales bacterium]